VSNYDEAIRGDDGRVDSGYLAMYWAMRGWAYSSAAIVAMGIYALWKATPSELGAIIQNVGIALAAVAGAFATVVGAVGLFRAGDKPHAITTTKTATETKTEPAPVGA